MEGFYPESSDSKQARRHETRSGGGGGIQIGGKRETQMGLQQEANSLIGKDRGQLLGESSKKYSFPY